MCKQNPIPILILLLFILFSSGCGSSNVADDDYYSENVDGEWAANEPASENTIEVWEPAPAESEYQPNVSEIASSQEDTQRIVIMNARMTISSRNPERVVDSVASLAAQFGGFVVTSNLRQQHGLYGVEVPEANIKIRVPAEYLQQALETIKGLATEVLYQSQVGQDVTREYTDLQSRLRNLETAAAQLEEIMASADETEDVLDVYQELTTVNQDAEEIRGQIAYYEQAAALSSIDLTIIQIMDPTPTPTPTATPTPRPTSTPRPWVPEETYKEAKDDLTSSFQGWINSAIRFFVYFLPTFIFWYVPWLAAFFFLGRWIYRKYNKLNIKE
jgi:hypothetical protein